MSSKIDPSGINSLYPIASINQSSQGFRDNFQAIKTALVNAKSESTLLLGTTITVSGDGLGSSTSDTLEVSGGKVVINLSLDSHGTSGNYDTLSDIVRFSLSDHGIVTSIVKEDPLPIFNSSGIKVNKNGLDSSFPDSTGIQSIDFPTFTTNGGGRVVSSGTTKIEGFGLLGYDMPYGGLLVGNANTKSSYLSPGSAGQVLGVSSNGMSLEWSTPTSGTVSSVLAGPGLTITNPNSKPEIDLAINNLPTSSLLTNAMFLTYTGQQHVVTPWSAIVAGILDSGTGAGFMRKVSDDLNPSLGGDLDVGNKKITSSSSSVNIQSSSGDINLQTQNGKNINLNSNGKVSFANSGSVEINPTGQVSIQSSSLLLNKITIPNSLPPKNGMILVSDLSGKLSWSTPSQGVQNIIGTSPISVIGDANRNYTVSFQPWNLSPGTMNGNSLLVATDIASKTSKLVSVNGLINESTLPNITYVSLMGSDSTGNGSLYNPYATIGKAIQENKSNIVLFPGTYSENVSLTNIYLGSILPDTVSLTGEIISNGSSNINQITISGKLTVSGSLDINNGELDINSQVTVLNNSILEVVNSSIAGSIDNQGDVQKDGNGNKTYTSNNTNTKILNCMANDKWTVSSRGQLLLTNTPYASVTHLDGSVNILNCDLLSDITSSSNNGILSIRNSSLSNENGTWNKINKTGTCQFILQNVSRSSSQDTLVGTRLEFSNTDNDIGDVVKTDDITGNYTVDNNTRYYDLTIKTTNPTIVFTKEDFDSSKYSRSINLIIRGSSTSGGNINWQGVFWSDGSRPSWNSSNGSITLFNFTYVNNIGWVGTYSSDNQITLDPDSNNLLQKTSNGYMVELKAADDVSNQYVSSSTGNDITGDGSQAKPFKTIRRALNRVPDHTQVWIHLYSGDTFPLEDGADGYVENGTLSQVLAGNFYVGSRNITFLPYNNTIWDSIPSGVATDSPNIGTQPLIRFTYSKTSDTAQYTCAGFALGSGSLYFTQISFTVKSDNLPSTSTTAAWAAPFTINDGTVNTYGCNFNLSNGVVFGADGGNESTGRVVLGATNYYNTTNGSALMDAGCGYTLKAPFGDITGGNNIVINGTDTGLKQKAGNFNASVANSNSFLNLNVINADARIYAGLTTQNLIKQV